MTLKRAFFYIAVLLIFPAICAGQFDFFYPSTIKPGPGPGNFPWIQHSRFFFCRLDGGPLEVDKGVISGWPFLNDQANRMIMGDLYSRYAERILDVMQQMHVNWVWVTWSNGFSLKKEKPQWQQCRDFITRCHARGIRVTGYLSMCNIFWENMFEDMPESRNWVRKDFWGNPVLFAGNRKRYLADLRQYGWQELMLTRVKSAVEAGVDALYFDNIAGSDAPEAVPLLRKIRALTKQMRNPQGIPLYCNSKSIPAINAVCELTLGEGTREPGIFQGQLVTNIPELKKLQSLRPLGMIYVYEHSQNANGPRREALMSPKGYKISMAEAAAFQASYYIAPEGVTLKNLINGTPEGEALIATIGNYHQFFLTHQDLLNGMEPVGDSTEIIFGKVTLKNAPLGVVASLDKKPDGSLFVLHILNYAQQTAKNIEVTLSAGVLPGPLTFKAMSPDDGTIEIPKIYHSREGLTIQVPAVDNYMVLSLTPANRAASWNQGAMLCQLR